MASANLSGNVPSKAQVLSLFRSLLRTARQFSDYNVKEYTKRRTIDAFRHNHRLTDPSSLASAYSDGEAQLQIAKRQAVVYSLYAPNIKSVMELKLWWFYLVVGYVCFMGSRFEFGLGFMRAGLMYLGFCVDLLSILASWFCSAV